MKLVEQPAEKVDRISVFRDLETAMTGVRDFLQELVRRDLGLELSRVPDFAREHGEATDEFRCGRRRRKWREDEIVAEGRNVQNELEDGVHVGVELHVVEPNEAGMVRFLDEIVRRRESPVNPLERRRVERRFEQVLDVGEGGIVDFVPVREHIDFLRFEVDENMVVLVEGVRVGRRRLAPSLKVLSVDQTGVDVVVRESDRTQALKVEVERRTVDL